MKLFGVELINFACFERQFIPLLPGINLLVGKNNSGKTATLRALAALHPQSASVRPPISAYLPFADRPAEIHVLFHVEKDDAPITEKRWWDEFMTRHAIIAAYCFQLWKMTDQIVFDRMEYRAAGITAPTRVIETSEQGIARVAFLPADSMDDLPRKEHTRNFIISGGNIVSIPAGRKTILPEQISGFEYLSPLRRSRLVSPHRIVPEGMQIQTASDLPGNASNLPIYLQTLQGNSRAKFMAVERFVTEVFPEFEFVNPAGRENQVFITLTRRGSQQEIPLVNCGTGVEQLLALATFIAASDKNDLLLLDEPHSFLHPSAERHLFQFLSSQTEKFVLVSTHSEVLINAVAPERVTYLNPPGTPLSDFVRSGDTDRILFDLGYRNTDALTYERLIFVEGASDSEILPVLLKKAGMFDDASLERIGYPNLQGVPRTARAQQSVILQYERLLTSVGRKRIPRLYIFDGDRANDEIQILSRTAAGGTAQIGPVKILPRTEIENYLLVPRAISQAITQEAKLAGIDVTVSPELVKKHLDTLLASNETSLYPSGKTPEPMRSVKGSVALQRIYEHFGNLSYNKKHSGRLIAQLINSADETHLTELIELFSFLLASPGEDVKVASVSMF